MNSLNHKNLIKVQTGAYIRVAL